MLLKTQRTLGIDSGQVLWWKSEKDFGKRVLRTWHGWYLKWRTEKLSAMSRTIDRDQKFINEPCGSLMDGGLVICVDRHVQGLGISACMAKRANALGCLWGDTCVLCAARHKSFEFENLWCPAPRLETRIKEFSVRASCRWNTLSKMKVSDVTKLCACQFCWSDWARAQALGPERWWTMLIKGEVWRNSGGGLPWYWRANRSSQVSIGAKD